MAEEFGIKNQASLNYADTPELVEEFSSLAAGDTGSARINFTVRRNDDNTLEVDITEIVLPETGPASVSTDVVDAEGADVVGDVLNEESPAAGEPQLQI